MSADPNTIVALKGAELDRMVDTLVTCPFLGSAVAEGKLSIRNDAIGPLASIEDVRILGNSGGGDLGEVLALFATGNHAFMRGDDGRLDRPAPSGLFSLELPGSQGAHPGHSGILMGDPETPGSGRLSLPDFARLASREKDGLIKRSDVGRFIAENLSREAKVKVFSTNVAEALGGDLLGFGATIVPALISKLAGSTSEAKAALQDLEEKFTKLAGEDNLLGSAGEFGLLFALVAHRPEAREIDGEPTVSVQDLESMFVKKRLPEGFEMWRKSRTDWIENTIGLVVSAAKEFHRPIRTH